MGRTAQFYGSKGELLGKFRECLRRFEAEHNRLPTYDEYKSLQEGPGLKTLKRRTGSAYKELCQKVMGAPIRKGKQANMPAGPYR